MRVNVAPLQDAQPSCQTGAIASILHVEKTFFQPAKLFNFVRTFLLRILHSIDLR